MLIGSFSYVFLVSQTYSDGIYINKTDLIKKKQFDRLFFTRNTYNSELDKSNNWLLEWEGGQLVNQNKEDDRVYLLKFINFCLGDRWDDNNLWHMYQWLFFSFLFLFFCLIVVHTKKLDIIISTYCKSQKTTPLNFCVKC